MILITDFHRASRVKKRVRGFAFQENPSLAVGPHYLRQIGCDPCNRDLDGDSLGIFISNCEGDSAAAICPSFMLFGLICGHAIS